MEERGGDEVETGFSLLSACLHSVVVGATEGSSRGGKECHHKEKGANLVIILEAALLQQFQSAPTKTQQYENEYAFVYSANKFDDEK